jgi:hypothetical protein
VIRKLGLAALTFALIAMLSPAGQEPPADKPEPPVKLEKKVRPKTPDDAKPDDKPAPKVKEEPKNDAKVKGEPKDKTDPGPDPEQVIKEILDRIGKNMRAAEERLKAKDSGDGTQQVQRDIVQDLDKLIKQEENAQQQQDQDQNQQQQQAGMGGGQPKQGGKSSSRSQRSARGKSGQQGQGQGQGQVQGQQAKGGQEKGQQGQGQGQGQGGSGNDGGMGGTSPAGVNKLADLYKDIWGELPLALRQEMDAYQKESYMAKYKELLKQYYATIAEKGRRQNVDPDK